MQSTSKIRPNTSSWLAVVDASAIVEVRSPVGFDAGVRFEYVPLRVIEGESACHGVTVLFEGCDRLCG